MGSSNDILALGVEHIHKDFLLPHAKKSSLKGAFASILKKEDKRYEHQHALKDVSFDIKKGEFFGIVGRNGSGKSTLLKILAGIYQPTKGSVSVSGKLVPFIELGVGFNPELTGRENVFLNGAMLGFSEKEITAMYDDIVGFAELERFMDQKLKNYSSGMQVRLAFSMATRANADILLIDEVLAVGDADFQRKCFEYFRELKKNKKTVVFVSHDMGAVQAFCTKAVLIEGGKVKASGSAANIAAQYNQMFLNQATTAEKEDHHTSKESPSGEARWGDGMAKWKTVDVSLRLDEKTKEASRIKITATGYAKEDIGMPIFGFSIKNQMLEQLVGTNTMRSNREVAPIKKGEKFHVTWDVPNVFNTGRHYVDCTVAHDQASMVSERWPEAAQFTIARAETNPYMVYTPDIQFEYEEIRK